MNKMLGIGILFSLTLHVMALTFVSSKENFFIQANTSASALVINVETSKEIFTSDNDKTPKKTKKETTTGTAGVVQKETLQVLGALAPEYPWRSRMGGEEGIVIVQVSIAQHGSPVTASIVKSSGHARLDNSALKAAKDARYSPHNQNVAQLDLTIDFKLRGQK